jgi:hypothetical protein
MEQTRTCGRNRILGKHFELILPALVFLVVVLLANVRLFRTPIIEDGDFAADALQVQNAMHFRELLGNYSRWRFHHPGPGFFYLYAAGEYVFYDLLHVVPAPLNAHILTIIGLNVFFLFASIAVIRRHCSTSLFIPVAILLSIFFIYLANAGSSLGENMNGALVSVWPPHVLLFCFLFLLTACASVAADNVRHLPLVFFSGMLLLHGHVAQVLFVAVLIPATCFLAWIREKGTPREILQRYTKPLLISAAILVAFALPILLDIFLHHPNNVNSIRDYMRLHRGQQNSFLVSLRYYLTFIRFIRNPEVSSYPGAEVSFALTRGYVWVYWSVFLLMSALGVLAHLRSRKPIDRFFLCVLVEVVLVSLLFLFWASRITGQLYHYNGFFIYSLQLLVLLSLAAFFLSAVPPPHLPARSTAIVACLVPFSILMVAPSFRNSYPGNPEVLRAALNVPVLRTEAVRLVFAPPDWPFAAGVASGMKREHKLFCVTRDWEFMFGADNTCRDPLKTTKLLFVKMTSPCISPCQVLFEDRDISVQLRPYESRKIPFQIGVKDIGDAGEGFYDSEGTHVWSQRIGVIRFLLAGTFSEVSQFRLRLYGMTLPGRPVQISLNNRILGTIDGEGFRNVDFLVSGDVFRPDADNTISFSVEKAGPVGDDSRTLGYGFSYLQVEQVASGSRDDRLENSSDDHNPRRTSVTPAR